MNRKRKRNLNQPTKAKKPICTSHNIQPVKTTSLFERRFSKYWKIFGGIVLILMAWLTYAELKNLYKTQKEKFNDEQFNTGIIITRPVKIENKDLETHSLFFLQPINDSSPIIKGLLIPNFKNKTKITFAFAGKTIEASPLELLKGIELNAGDDECDHKIRFGIQDDRLYVSLSFMDLIEDKPIGSIEYNRWKIKKGNFFDYNSTETSLEVIDNRFNIVFNIKYLDISDDNGGFAINGYFSNYKSALVLSGNITKDREIIAEPNKKGGFDMKYKGQCFIKSDPHWRDKAMEEIATIKSIFPKNILLH